MMAKKKQKNISLDERLKEAIDEGNLEKALVLYEEESKGYAAMGLGMPRGFDLTPDMVRQAVVNGSTRDPRGMSLQIMRRILSVQTMLLVRAEQFFLHAVKAYDDKYGGYLKMNTQMPPELAEEYLPRIGKLQESVKSTIKSLLALENEDASDNGAKAA